MTVAGRDQLGQDHRQDGGGVPEGARAARHDVSDGSRRLDQQRPAPPLPPGTPLMGGQSGGGWMGEKETRGMKGRE